MLLDVWHCGLALRLCYARFLYTWRITCDGLLLYVTALAWDGVMRWRWLGQGENGIIYTSNMSGEMHMEGRHDAKVRYSAAYPTGAERIVSG